MVNVEFTVPTATLIVHIQEMSGGGNDAKFFTRGKIQEFKAELQEAERGKDKKFTKRKTVLKKIVANITMGNDSRSY